MIETHEIIGLIAGTLTTSAFVPQVYKTWKTKSAKGLSLYMYIIFFIGVLTWLYYGILIQSFPIILVNGVTAILTLILLYFKLIFKK